MLPEYNSCKKTISSVAYILVYQGNRKHRKNVFFLFLWLQKLLELSVQSCASVCIPYDWFLFSATKSPHGYFFSLPLLFLGQFKHKFQAQSHETWQERWLVL